MVFMSRRQSQRQRTDIMHYEIDRYSSILRAPRMLYLFYKLISKFIFLLIIAVLPRIASNLSCPDLQSVSAPTVNPIFI